MNKKTKHNSVHRPAIMERLMNSFRGLRDSVQPGKEGRGREEAPTMRRSEYSLVSCSDVTSGVLSVWSDLPEQVKNDPSLASFREKVEKQYGAASQVSAMMLPRVDEDVRGLEEGVLATASGPNGQGPDGQDPDLERVRLALNKEKLPPLDEKEQSLSSHGSHRDLTLFQKVRHWVKLGVLLCVWLFFTIVFMVHGEKEHSMQLSYVQPSQVKVFRINETWNRPDVTLRVYLEGPFLSEQNERVREHGAPAEVVQVWLEATDTEGSGVNKKSNIWSIVLLPSNSVDFSQPEKRQHRLSLELLTPPNSTKVSLHASTNSSGVVPVGMSYHVNPVSRNVGVTWSLVLLAGLYAMIIFEIINRTLAAVIASSCALAVLALVGERPNLLELVSWLDVETLILLFSMMLLVAVTAETGLFDYLAVYTFSVTKGKMWPLINLLCFFTAFFSTFLDNVTTVLLMTPVTIRLCELMELNPVPVLMSMVIFSNVGGTATPVGDPPNVIIASNADVIASGVNFANFTMHMLLGILLVSVQTYIQLRFFYRDVNKLRLQLPKDIQDLKQQISVWRRAAAAIGAHSRDEEIVRHALMKKVNKLERRLAELDRERKKRAVSEEKFQDLLLSLRDKYKIRDKVLLYKSAIAIGFVVLVFFLHAIPELRRISLGWTALLGAILLLILADREDMENVLARVEWCTLLFFAALFVLMEALAMLGLIQWIGGLTEALIMSVDKGSRLAVALVLILWVSGMASAFVDNIPLTTMMIRVATSLGANPELGLPMPPLIWALSFGACLGGNGTLIGASANVVTAGVAEQHGYRFTFMDFFKVGFPVMLGQLATATVYLLVCHCVFAWH